MTSKTLQSSVPALVRKQNIGNTTYIVNVHYNQACTESAEDKMKRIIERECKKSQ